MVVSLRSPKKLRKEVKTFHATFGNTNLSGEAPIMKFNFPTAFVTEASTFGGFEAYEILIVPKLLMCQAEKHLRSNRNGARSGSLACSPEVANYFLRTNATPTTICNAVHYQGNICQQRREDELTYRRRIKDAAHCRTNISNEFTEMTTFGNELLQSFQTIIACF